MYETPEENAMAQAVREDHGRSLADAVDETAEGDAMIELANRNDIKPRDSDYLMLLVIRDLVRRIEKVEARALKTLRVVNRR